MVDGAGPVQIFFRVIFPVLRSVMMTVIILQSVLIYNDFQHPLYFLPGTENATIQLTLLNFQSQFTTQYHLLFATILLVTIPPLIMFIFFNRKIVEGMAAGSVKGVMYRRSPANMTAPSPLWAESEKENRMATYKPSVSMKDVAALAGVSLGTVSNVVNSPGLVSDQTRQRVQPAIAKLGWVPNESARQLRAGRSRSIGMVVMDIANPFFTDLVLGR